MLEHIFEIEKTCVKPQRMLATWHGTNTILAELLSVAAYAQPLQTRQNRLARTQVHSEDAAPEVNEAAPTFTRIPPVYRTIVAISVLLLYEKPGPVLKDRQV